MENLLKEATGLMEALDKVGKNIIQFENDLNSKNIFFPYEVFVLDEMNTDNQVENYFLSWEKWTNSKPTKYRIILKCINKDGQLTLRKPFIETNLATRIKIYPFFGVFTRKIQDRFKELVSELNLTPE